MPSPSHPPTAADIALNQEEEEEVSICKSSTDDGQGRNLRRHPFHPIKKRIPASKNHRWSHCLLFFLSFPIHISFGIAASIALSPLPPSSSQLDLHTHIASPSPWSLEEEEEARSFFISSSSVRFSPSRTATLPPLQSTYCTIRPRSFLSPFPGRASLPPSIPQKRWR